MSEIANMLGNESRLILLQLLAEGEKSVEILSEESGIPVANTSQHLQALKKANLVITRRDGKRILYRWESGPMKELFLALEKFAIYSTAQDDHSNLKFKGRNSELSTSELQKKMKKGGILLIDVRSKEEYKKGHIPEAINIPYNELETYKFPKNKELIVYCRGPLCLLSVNALNFLQSRELSVTRYGGGYRNWESGEN
ncbi:MAG: metalloregulator ArsR/SmtB family transcription factor [Leptospira sp.]|uniref:Metalloregulator ArsR/SmtB family transcription factor n=1 Tax=Leptospira paudalimensis TaxID=2950024 RepID=A0ABT3M4Q3_9LEPT|nr:MULTISPECIES: metalloregulator ArsR/SmtB family transcription factor [Leptospira]MBL0956364.1 metalloregulator ArsR/SmtB family transcription factor [Leptospira sp.]MCW7502996.1 metalloregulator ArsR/SmtB family transcription factor [Leptospira paudalimensis]